MRARTTALAAASVLGALGNAAAQPRPAEADFSASLDYRAPSGCPRSDEFRRIVSGRLGFDPFVSSGAQHVFVSITGGEQALSGRIEWRDDSGNWAGDQTFPARASDCAGLVHTMGFALAVQINLLATGRSRDSSARTAERDAEHAAERSAEHATGASGASAPSSESRATRSGAPREPAAAATAERATASAEQEPHRGRPWTFSAGAGTSVALGVAPSVVVLGRLFAAVGWRRWSLELGGELSTKSFEYRADGAGFAEQLAVASLAACASANPWSVCLLAKVGSVDASGRRIDVPASPSGKALQAGARLAFRQPLGRWAFVAARVEGLGNLTRWNVTLDAVPVWTAPIVAGTLGLDLGAAF